MRSQSVFQVLRSWTMATPEEKTGFGFGREHVCARPRALSNTRSLRPDGGFRSGARVSEGPESIGSPKMRGSNMSKLSNAQLLLLTGASERADRCAIAPTGARRRQALHAADQLVQKGPGAVLGSFLKAPEWDAK